MDAVAAPQLRRIAFVTSRFLELQGLLPAAFGMALVFGCLVVRVTGDTTRHIGEYQGVLFAAICSPLLGREIQASYRRVHGDAVGTIPQKLFAMLPTMLVVTGAIVDMLSRESGRPDPSAAAIALVAFSGFIVVRDWPWRLHHVVGVAAGVMGALSVESYILAYTLIGLSMVATGVLDHHLLTQSLAPRPKLAPPPARPLLRAGVALAFCLAGGIATSEFSAIGTRFVLPMMLLLAVLAVQVGLSVRDISAWARAVNAGERAPGPAATWIPADVLLLTCALTVAAAIDTVLLPRPLVLAATIAASSVWVAFRRRPVRWHYVLGAIAGVEVFVLMPRLDPARALALLIFVTGGAVAVQALVDHWMVRHAHSS